MLLDQFQSMPVALLTVAAIIAILTGGFTDAVVIMGVVVINAIIGFATESQSDRIIRSLDHLVKPSARVIRDGGTIEISAQEVVPGDILVLRSGTYIAADARIIAAADLSVDESTLTGESIPVTKTAKVLTDIEIPLGDRINMVYMGTLVMGGEGRAVVVATATATEMGKIQALIGNVESPKTPMETQLDQVGSQLVVISSVICGIVFAIGVLRGYALFDMLKTSISLAVAAVPEGLPAVATTTLALGIWRMRQQHVLIRRLDAVETLGAVQALCLDKTGTLTANQMSVVELDADNLQVQIQAGQWQQGENPIIPNTHPPVWKLLQIIALCNESEFDRQSQTSEFKGSSTENALLQLAIAAGIDTQQLRHTYPRLQIQHRADDRNVMVTVHQSHSTAYLLAVKGNPVEVLALCDRYLDQDQEHLLTPAQHQRIIAANDRMANQALRVLGIAYRETSTPTPTDHLIWLGLVGMADPIRPGVKEVIEVFHQAGIDTIMVTGDQRQTAFAIGQALNLSQDATLQILDATDLATLNSQPTIADRLHNPIHIFARISPANKLQVVQALQQAGKVVAMTGDGINDAPALKAAAVGIAMGHSGTDVAREVADVVLEDDNLATMAIAISQGRSIYQNIRKAVHFLLSTNLSEIMVMFVSTSLGIGQPLTAMQLLWLNLVTDIFPGLALALEAPEPNILLQPPRDPAERIIPNLDFQRILSESTVLSLSALAAYGYALWNYGIGFHASTIGFMSLTLAQLVHAISCRSQVRTLFSSVKLPANPYLAIALAVSITLQFITIAIPGLRSLLKLTPLTPLDMIVIAISSLLPLLVNEFTKSTATPRTK
jgi:Ca2+-transporting ATPase